MRVRRVSAPSTAAVAGGVVNIVTRSGGNLFSGLVPHEPVELRVERRNAVRGSRRGRRVRASCRRPTRAMAGGPIAEGSPLVASAARASSGRRRRIRCRRPASPTPARTTNRRVRGQADRHARARPQTLQGTFIDSRTDQFAASHPNSDRSARADEPGDQQPASASATWRGALAGTRVRDRAVSRRSVWQVGNNGGTSTDDRRLAVPDARHDVGVPAGLQIQRAVSFDSTDPDGRNNRQATASLSYLLGTQGLRQPRAEVGRRVLSSRRAQTGNSQTSTGYIFSDRLQARRGRQAGARRRTAA